MIKIKSSKKRPEQKLVKGPTCNILRGKSPWFLFRRKKTFTSNQIKVVSEIEVSIGGNDLELVTVEVPNPSYAIKNKKKSKFYNFYWKVLKVIIATSIKAVLLWFLNEVTPFILF